MTTRIAATMRRQSWTIGDSTQALRGLGLVVALMIGLAVWHTPPPAPLDTSGMHFLATLSSAIVLWLFAVFDEYIVALLLLLSWLVLDIVPPQLAVAGFSQSSWFFLLGALGIAAAVNSSGLLERAVTNVLTRWHVGYGHYTWALTFAGFVTTPIVPEVKARLAIVAPFAYRLVERIGFKPRSNGSAGICLASYLGFSQLTFMFLNGATSCFVGWSLLPDWAKAEFGWSTWVFVTLPAGIVFAVLLNAFLLFSFRVSREEQDHMERCAFEVPTADSASLTARHWLTMGILALALVGWMTKRLHGISEAWIALAALAVFLMIGILDKKGLKNGIDWGFLLFFGVIYSMAGLVSHLKIDVWLMELVGPVLAIVSGDPLTFLMAVLMLMYVTRIFLAKSPAVILLGLGLMASASEVGVHPGILIVTMLMAVETWVFPYQTPSYLIAYQGSDGKAFSHGQGRKLMAAKFIVSFIAVAISVPYWSWLGFIEKGPSVDRVPSTVQNAPRGPVFANNSTGNNQTDRARLWFGQVADIQRMLADHGFDPGPIDGILGPRTRTAIHKYQQASGLTVNGEISWSLLVQLREGRRRRAIERDN